MACLACPLIDGVPPRVPPLAQARPVDPSLVKVITMPGLPVEVFMRPVSSPTAWGSSPRNRLRFAVEKAAPSPPAPSSIASIAGQHLRAKGLKHALLAVDATLSNKSLANEPDRLMLNVTSIGEAKTEQLEVRV